MPLSKLTILMDMDGVIADFTTAALKAHHVNPDSDLSLVKPEHVDTFNFFEKYGMSEDEFWLPINNTPEFWADIPLYEGAMHFIDDIEDIMVDVEEEHDIPIKLVFASAPNRQWDCVHGKVKWLYNHFGISSSAYP